jgi:hypothetical protein
MASILLLLLLLGAILVSVEENYPGLLEKYARLADSRLWGVSSF